VGKDWIMGTVFVRPVDVPASLDNGHVTVFGSPFGKEKVMPAVEKVKMRRLGTLIAAALRNPPGGGQLFPGKRVYFAQVYPPGISLHSSVGTEPRFAPAEKQGRIDAALIHVNRIRPGAPDISGMNNEIPQPPAVLPGIGIGGGHVKNPVVETNGGRVDPPGGAAVLQGKLLRTVEAVTQKFPVNQIPAVINRYSGKELKTRANQVIILPPAADARIRIKTGDYGVLIGIHDNVPLGVYRQTILSAEMEFPANRVPEQVYLSCLEILSHVKEKSGGFR
jgi:hypothetical protein